MAAVAASPLGGVSSALGHAAVMTGSTIQKNRDVLFGLELTREVLAQARLVARDDEIVSSHDCHMPILYETRATVKVGGAARGPVGPSALSWKDGGGCRAWPGRAPSNTTVNSSRDAR